MSAPVAKTTTPSPLISLGSPIRPMALIEIMIAITADGRVHYGGQEIGLYGIGPVLSRLAVTPEQPVVIQADGEASTQFLISALDEVKAAGVENVNVATLQE